MDNGLTTSNSSLVGGTTVDGEVRLLVDNSTGTGVGASAGS